MAQVVFDPAAFKIAYPEFAATANGFLQTCFDIATLYLSNEDCSVVQDITKRQSLLWMLTAHIAALRGALNPAGAAGGPGPVGRISSATEGSVSISTDFPSNPTNAWFIQTAYGAMFWQATSSLRGFRYRPRATCVDSAWRPY